MQYTYTHTQHWLPNAKFFNYVLPASYNCACAAHSYTHRKQEQTSGHRDTSIIKFAFKIRIISVVGSLQNTNQIYLQSTHIMNSPLLYSVVSCVAIWRWCKVLEAPLSVIDCGRCSVSQLSPAIWRAVIYWGVRTVVTTTDHQPTLCTINTSDSPV